MSICNRQPHHDRGEVLVPRDAAAGWTLRPKFITCVNRRKIPLVMSPDETNARWPLPAVSRLAFSWASAMAAAYVPARWCG
jgi:hypothetical protein